MKKWHNQRYAPDPGTFLCQTGDIGENQVKEFRFGGNSPFAFRMFLYNDGRAIRAYRNACPHFDVPLNHVPGEVFTADRRHFLCMTHHAMFEPCSGLCVQGPCVGESLEVIPLRREGEQLLVGEPGQLPTRAR